MQMMLTVRELSVWLNVKPSTLYLWASQGKIPCRRMNGLIRFETLAIQSWLEGSPRPHSPITLGRRLEPHTVDAIIEAAKREVYTPRHGETRPKSGLIGKGEADGAV